MSKREHKARETQNATIEYTRSDKDGNNKQGKLWFVSSNPNLSPQMYVKSKDIEGVCEHCPSGDSVDYTSGYLKFRLWVTVNKNYHIIYVDNSVALNRRINSWSDLAKFWRVPIETAKYVVSESESARTIPLTLYLKERQNADKQKLAEQTNLSENCC